MKIFLLVFIAAVGSARRPPRGFDIDYRDSPAFFDSPLPSSSHLSFLSPSSRHQSYPRELQSFSDVTSIISDSPPSYRKDKTIYSSFPPSSSYYPRKPQNFYKSEPPSFAQELSILDEYRGPPPLAPYKDPRKQTSVTGDERPGATLLQLHTTMADEQKRYKAAEQPIRLEIPTRQTLSFGGHSNHLSYGNYGLGFASVAGAMSAHLDPLAIAEMTTATPSEVQVSQQQSVTNTPNPTEMQTSAKPKIISTVTQPSTTKTASSSSDSKSTASSTSTTLAMTSVTPKIHLDLARNSPIQTTKAVPMMLQEPLRMSYEFRTVTQELPVAAHSQLRLESPRPELSHVLDIKQNLLHEGNKANFPYQQFGYQFHQQNSNNAAALRFTIPTAMISTLPLSTATATATDTVLPAKPVTQGLSFPQTQLAIVAVPNSNTYPTGQNQIDQSQLGQVSLMNTAPQLPSYYYAQNTEQVKSPQISSNIPLTSYFMLPNNVQPRQSVHINAGVPSGIPLQLNGFGGIELLTSANNLEPIRPDILGLERAGFNMQSQIQSPEPTFATIGFGQNIW